MLKKYNFARHILDIKYSNEHSEKYKVNNHVVNRATFLILFFKVKEGYRRSNKYSYSFETDDGYSSNIDIQTYERIEK